MFMKFLVAGGAGFLGSHLMSRLLEEEHEVLCVDNLHTGTVTNITNFKGRNNFTFLKHDIRNPIDVKVDGIFNLACPASPTHYQKAPLETFMSCVLGSWNLLELAKINKCRILQASTSEIYGDPSITPQPETYWGNVNSTGPRSCYDEGKRGAETLFTDHHRVNGTDIRIARIFNTYGPQMSRDDGRVVSNFIIQALEQKNITIYGDGNQTRSFCYVTDLIDGLMKLSFSEHIYFPVNLGNPTPITVTQLASEIIDFCNSKSTLLFQPPLVDDPLQREPDITRARELLNWWPQVSRKEGLQRTIDYFKG
jgi:UDP-glucuronate decarboxylase